MASADERSTDFERHNLFFLGVLGVVSAAKRLDRLLEVHTCSARAESNPKPATTDDPILCFLLGVVAFRERFLDHLAQAARNPRPPAEAPRVPTIPLTPREVLR